MRDGGCSLEGGGGVIEWRGMERRRDERRV